MYVSFIVIGKNEGRTLKQCFDSIKQYSENNMIDYEVIYVDSQSTDDSVKIASRNKMVKTYLIEKPCTPAIARNSGAGKSSGNLLFFLDGDMIINSYSRFSDIVQDGKAISPFQSASWIDVYGISQDSDVPPILENGWDQSTVVKPVLSAGGLFIIEREIWLSLNGMDELFICNEDKDLGFRYYRKYRMKIMKLSTIMAFHYTTHYFDSERYYHLVKEGYFISKGYLLRKHLFSLRLVLSLFSGNTLSFMLTIIISIISILLGRPIFLLSILMVHYGRVLVIKDAPLKTSKLIIFILNIIVDFQSIFGIFTYDIKKYFASSISAKEK